MKKDKPEKRPVSLRAYLRFARPYRFLVAAFLAVSLVSLAANLAQANLLGRLIDAALTRGGGKVSRIAALYGAVLLADLLCAFFMKYLYGNFSARYLHDFRRHAADHLQRIPLSVMETHHSGDLLSRLAGDLQAVQDFMAGTLVDAYKQAIMLAAAASYMAWLNWRLLLVSIATVPFALIVLNVLIRPMQKYWYAASQSLGEANATAQDALGGILTVKAYNLQASLAARYGVRIKESMDWDTRAASVMRWTPPFNILMRAMPTVFCMGYGSFLILRGELTPGGLIAFNFLLGFVQWPLAFLPDLISRMKRAKSAAERVSGILDIPREREDGADFSRSEQAEALRVRGLSFSYREGCPVLAGLDFSLARGERLAIVGPSGCGKSTVLKLLCGAYETHTGEIMVNGHDTREWALSALRSRFSAISQDIFLFPETIRANIAYGKPGAGEAEIAEAARISNAAEFIDRLPDGYETQVGERGLKLSGGQKQRVALARAILKDAPILLLDEPTSALDTHSENLVQEAIERSLAGKTAIIVAHRLSTIKNADRILVMDGGKIAERGTHGELMAAGGLYAALYARQFNSGETESAGENDER